MKNVRRYLNIIGAIIQKDLQIEWRGRQGLPVMLVFSLTIVFVFNFALQLSPELQADLSAGLLWVSLAFAATLGLNRSVSLERENDALDGLLLAPVDRSAVFFGKSIGNFIFTTVVVMVLLPVFSLFYQRNMLMTQLLPILLLGISAYTSLGTLLAALSIQTRTRDILLPVLLFPMALPILIAATEATRMVLDGIPLSEIQAWILILLACVILFNAAGLMFFEMILEE